MPGTMPVTAAKPAIPVSPSASRRVSREFDSTGWGIGSVALVAIALGFSFIVIVALICHRPFSYKIEPTSIAATFRSVIPFQSVILSRNGVLGQLAGWGGKAKDLRISSATTVRGGKSFQVQTVASAIP
jgi:hypothetical protein